MDATKGATGRCVCGVVEVVVGSFGLGATISAIYGEVSILACIGAAFIISTASLGIASETTPAIIVYMVTGIIRAIGYGCCTIGFLGMLMEYEDQGFYCDGDWCIGNDDICLTMLILAEITVATALVVSILGITFASLPLCAKYRNLNMFQFQRFNEPAVGPPPYYDYSDTGFVHPAQTEQNNYGNKPVVGGGAPNIYNDSSTASVDTKQELVRFLIQAMINNNGGGNLLTGMELGSGSMSQQMLLGHPRLQLQ